jgi:hypothetical protein
MGFACGGVELEDVMTEAAEVEGLLFDLAFHQVHHCSLGSECARLLAFARVADCSFRPSSVSLERPWMNTDARGTYTSGKRVLAYIALICLFDRVQAFVVPSYY